MLGSWEGGPEEGSFRVQIKQKMRVSSAEDRNEVHQAVTGLRNKENAARARDVNLMQCNGQ